MTATDPLQEILFIDIETTPAFKTLAEVSEDLQAIWNDRQKKKRKKKTANGKDDAEERDGEAEPCEEEIEYGGSELEAEFGKIVCISLGRYEGGIDDEHFKLHSIAYHDEKQILNELTVILDRYSRFKLCAHNGKSFDIPFIGRRYLINHIPLPPQFQVMGKKPWELPFIDTMEMWGFGDNRCKIALKLLCAVFGIPSPEDDIDGSMVAPVYYGTGDLERIARYCEKDVVVTAKVYKKMMGYF